MAWVTWRQHRLQVLTTAGLVLVVGLTALVTSLPVRDAYHHEALAACLPPSTRPGCELIVNHFRGEFANLAEVARWLILFPALIGVLIGAPLLAREFEHGTFRLAWTQGVSRRRWLLSKTLLLVVVVLAAAVALAGIAMWWRVPFDHVDGRMSPAAFDIEGLVVPAYALFALAVGILAGLVLRHTLPALAVAAGLFLGARIGVENLLRPNYLAPLHATSAGLSASPGGGRNWVLDNVLVDAVGRVVSAAREDVAIVHAQRAGVDPQQYLQLLGYHRIVTFQPASRFWTFQGIEAAIFVALAAAALAAAVALLRRRPA
jgi:hypothetical protein